MNGWGSKWNKGQHGKLNSEPKEYPKDINLVLETNNRNSVWDGPKADEAMSIPKILNNKPTHDPYTNPNAHIYYECGCGAILDPGTKSFAQLNNCASEAGWKIRWGADSYVPYCVKCGEGVE